MVIKFQPSELNVQHRKKTSKEVLLNIIQYLVLFAIMILMGGHENTHPHTETNNIDYYLQQSQDLLKIQSNTFLNDSSIDSISNVNMQLEKLVSVLYSDRDYQSIWTINLTTTPNFNVLLNLLEDSKYYGFPKDYFKLNLLHELKSNLELRNSGNNDLQDRIALETQASKSALLLMIYLNQGILTNSRDSIYYSYIKSLPKIFNASIAENNLQHVILSLQPQIHAYKSLLHSAPDFIDMLAEINSQSVDSSRSDSLWSKAFYYARIIEKPCFDTLASKEMAISSFQKIYKLPIDSALNDTTSKVLCKLLEYRYYQLCLNFDRLRKLTKANETCLFVNIPEYQLHVYENYEFKDSYNIIVGKSKSETPVLSSAIEKIITNPFWTIPHSIVQNEMLTKIRTDSTYLKRNGYYIINNREALVATDSIKWDNSNPLGNKYWIRQHNKKGNALGQIKFIFPNEHSVYLHDTPSKRLFKRKNRAYSHGCIRLENPQKLAQYLANKYYSRKDSVNINSLISTKNRTIIKLDTPVNIYVQYITNSTDDGGLLHFHKDIYKKDMEAVQELFSVEITI